MIRLEGTITLATGVAFAIQPTNISTCFDQISALHLIDLRNEQAQRAKEEKREFAQVLYAKKTGWSEASVEIESIENNFLTAILEDR